MYLHVTQENWKRNGVGVPGLGTNLGDASCWRE